MLHIKDLLPKDKSAEMLAYSVDYFRDHVPELDRWAVVDTAIEKQRPLLLEYMRQARMCQSCTGYSACPKDGDMKGFVQVLEQYGGHLSSGVQRCQPFYEDLARKRVDRWRVQAGGIDQDDSFTFRNFPKEQRHKYPRLLKYAEDFAEQFQSGESWAGLYLFGPPGVGKTHLMLAVFNRLQARGIPCLFVRSDSIFDRMRHILAEGGDLEPFLETCATAPVLAIDEFAQERANDFTLEKLFRIINHRFHSKLPTWFTSNFAPPDIYRKGGADILDNVGPLRSRVMQMAKLGRMDGDDARQRTLHSLT